MPTSDSRLSQSVTGGPISPTWCKDLGILAVVAAVWFCALLGLRPLSSPDEGRYSEIPREMAATGDFITPRLNGVKYFEKPPLVYWLSAVTFKTLGVSKFTARLWAGLFSVIGVLVTYSAARALYGRAAGVGSAVVLATSLMFYALSQIILLDMAVAVTMSGCLFCFILAMREPPGRKRLSLFMTFYIFMALATLSKGLIGIALPGAVIFCWVVLLNRWRALWPFYPVAGTAVLVAIAAPWHYWAAQANPDFLNFYFVHEHWLRFTTPIHRRFEPFWYFLPVFVFGFFPWIFFTSQALRQSLAGGWQARLKNAEAWFFIVWTVFIIAFFSKSQSKLIPYILPVFPAMAVLVGRTLAAVWEKKIKLDLRSGTWAFVVTAIALTIAIALFPAPTSQPDIAAILPVLRLALSGSMLAGVAVAIFGLRQNQPRLMLGAVAISTAATLVVLNAGGCALDKSSTEKLATTLKPLLKSGDRVYSVGFYAQDLPVYLGQLIRVADERGKLSELNFGVEAEPELMADRFVNREKFIRQWAEPGAAYAVVRKSTYRNWFSDPALPHEVLGRTPRYVLAAKRASSPTP